MEGRPPIDDSYPTQGEPGPSAGPPAFEPGATIPVMRPQAPSRGALPSHWETWLPLLNNRLILSGLGLVVVLLLIAIVLVAIGHGDDGANARTVVSLPTSNAERTALAQGDLPAKILETASVRNGPDTTFAILGTVHRGANVSAIGRSTDQEWIQIRYPPGSNLRGWVKADLVDVAGDVAQLAVAGPGPTPAVDIPTQEPVPTLYIIATEEEPTSTPAIPTPVETATPTAEEATPTEEPLETPTFTPAATKIPGE